MADVMQRPVAMPAMPTAADLLRKQYEAMIQGFPGGSAADAVTALFYGWARDMDAYLMAQRGYR